MIFFCLFVLTFHCRFPVSPLTSYNIKFAQRAAFEERIPPPLVKGLLYSSQEESVCSISARSKRQWDHGGVADKDACTIHTFNIISERQYFVARCLSSYVDNVFGLHSICFCFPSIRNLRRQDAQFGPGYCTDWPCLNFRPLAFFQTSIQLQRHCMCYLLVSLNITRRKISWNVCPQFYFTLVCYVTSNATQTASAVNRKQAEVYKCIWLCYVLLCLCMKCKPRLLQKKESYSCA
jgi:hypothetical protein